MVKITNKIAKEMSKIFKINHRVIPFDEWKRALIIELEHGKKYGMLTNVTNDDIYKTCQIAVAHLIEDPRYYFFLEQMELKREEYWNQNKKPEIFKK